MNVEITDKQQKLIDEANKILKKLGKAGIGIVAIDGSFHWFNTDVWNIYGVELDCGASGFTKNRESIDCTERLPKEIECHH